MNQLYVSIYPLPLEPSCHLSPRTPLGYHRPPSRAPYARQQLPTNSLFHTLTGLYVKAILPTHTPPPPPSPPQPVSTPVSLLDMFFKRPFWLLYGNQIDWRLRGTRVEVESPVGWQLWSNSTASYEEVGMPTSKSCCLPRAAELSRAQHQGAPGNQAALSPGSFWHRLLFLVQETL